MVDIGDAVVLGLIVAGSHAVLWVSCELALFPAKSSHNLRRTLGHVWIVSSFALVWLMMVMPNFDAEISSQGAIILIVVPIVLLPPCVAILRDIGQATPKINLGATGTNRLGVVIDVVGTNMLGIYVAVFMGVAA